MPEAEARDPVRDVPLRLPGQHLGESDRADVRGVGENLVDRVGDGVTLLGVVDRPVGDLDLRRQRERARRGHQAVREDARDGDELEGGAGLIRVRYRAVPLQVLRDVRVVVRVVAGCAGHGEDGAGPRVHHDRRRRLRVPLVDRLPELELRVRLDRVVEGEVDVAAVPLGDGLDDVDGASVRILDHRLLPAAAGEEPVERQLEPREAAVVHSRVAQQRCAYATLRVDAALLRIEVHAGEMHALEPRGCLRISLALDVDEALRPVADLPVDVVRIEAELAAGGARDRLGLGHLARVDVDGRRLLADRELKAAAVEDRPAMGREVDRLLLLSRRKLLQRLRAHALQPDGAREDECEDEGEGEEEDPDPPVRSARHCRIPRG